jgi:hypothetical protein
VPDPAYTIDAWSDLFVAAAGATAALAGLVVVAVSINLDRIISYPGLPERGLVTIATLVAGLVVSLLGLAPGQSHTAFGIEILLLGAALAVWFSMLSRASVAADDEPSHFASAITIALFGSLPLAVAGFAVLTATIGGLYWVLAGLVTGVLAAVANAWVLLVEILR